MLARRKKSILFGVKLAIGLLLLAFLVVNDGNAKKLVEVFAGVRLIYLVPFLAWSGLIIGISCLKWRLFIQHERSLPFSRLFLMYLIGMFFNNFLPSSFGGDAVRSYLLGQQVGSGSQALASVFLERLTGFLAMVSLALLAFLLTPALQEDVLVQWTVLGIAGLTGGIVLALWRPGWIQQGLMRISAGSRVARWGAKLERFHACIQSFRHQPRVLMMAMAYSYGFYVLGVVNVYLAGQLLGIRCDLGQLFVVVPIVMLIAALPLTPNGLGVWEWAFSVYLTAAGTFPEQGLAIALVIRGKALLISLLGGALFLLDGSMLRLREQPVKTPTSFEETAWQGTVDQGLPASQDEH